MLVADGPFSVDDKDRGPGGDIPLGGNGTLLMSLPPGTPGDLFLLHGLLELFLVDVAVDAEQGERLAFQSFYERPLVRVHGPAGTSPVPPKIEDHHLAAIFA